MTTGSRPRAARTVQADEPKSVIKDGRKPGKDCARCGAEFLPAAGQKQRKYCSGACAAAAHRDQVKRSKQSYSASERGLSKNKLDQSLHRLRVRTGIERRSSARPELAVCTLPLRSWGSTLVFLESQLEDLHSFIVHHGPSPAARAKVEAIYSDFVRAGLARDEKTLRLFTRCLEMRVDTGVPAAEVNRFLAFLNWIEWYARHTNDPVREARTLVVRGNLLRSLPRRGFATRDWRLRADAVFDRAGKILREVPRPSRHTRLWEHRALVLGGRDNAIKGFREDGRSSIAETQLLIAQDMEEGFLWLETYREFACFATESGRWDAARTCIEKIEVLSKTFSGHLFDLAKERCLIELEFKAGDLAAAEMRIKTFKHTAQTFKSVRHESLAGHWERRLEGLPPSTGTSIDLRGGVYVPMCYFYADNGLLEYI